MDSLEGLQRGLWLFGFFSCEFKELWPIKIQVVVVHTFSPSTCLAEASKSLEFEANLIYGVSSRADKPLQRNSAFSPKWEL